MADTVDTPDEQQPWFPDTKLGWRLDVVTLLAVIGESSMTEHSQTITASVLCLLPRILPAPQALLKSARPTRMPETHARITGVYSGFTLDTVGFFANIIAPLDQYQPFAFTVLEIKHRDEDAFPDEPCPPVPDAPRVGSGSWPLKSFKLPWRVVTDEDAGEDAGDQQKKKKKEKQKDPEQGVQDGAAPGGKNNAGLMSGDGSATASGNNLAPGPDMVPKKLQRQLTLRDKATDAIATMSINSHRRPAVPANLYSPIHILTVFSFLLSLGILAGAIYWHDGNAIIAVTLISLASSIIGYASWWEPRLMSLARKNKVPAGDVMIRTREGAFIYIKCTEGVARELFFGTEECKYRVGNTVYNALMAIGTVILMLAVVLLGNCKWNAQIFIGGSYIVLNGLYWGLGMIPKSYFWDLSRYTVTDVTPRDALGADSDVRDVAGRKIVDPERMKSFTRTLWYAIRETRTKGWVERSGAAPPTDQWRRWLEEAERQAKAGRRDWGAVKRKDEIFEQEGTDSAEQHAPATEVQGERNVPPKGSL